MLLYDLYLSLFILYLIVGMRADELCQLHVLMLLAISES